MAKKSVTRKRAKKLKPKTEVKIDASLLDKIKEAEHELSNKSRPKDLDGLPPGHPLLTQFEQAHQRWEQQQAVVERQKEVKTGTSRKQTQQQRQSAQRQAEERADEAKKSVKTVNKKISDLQKRVVDLAQSVSGQETLVQYPFAKARLARLSRMLIAFHRGLDDSKLSPTRFELY